MNGNIGILGHLWRGMQDDCVGNIVLLCGQIKHS